MNWVCGMLKRPGLPRRLEARHLSAHWMSGQVILHLQAHPDFDARTEGHREELCRFRRDRTFALNDLVHAAEWHLDVLGEGILRDAHYVRGKWYAFWGMM
jgi:hypothetical protein